MVEWTQICYADTPSEDILCKAGKKGVKNDAAHPNTPKNTIQNIESAFTHAILMPPI